MKNTSKLLALILALTVAVSGIVITTLTANAAERPLDTQVYKSYNGADCSIRDAGWNNDNCKMGTAYKLDYYEKDLYAPATTDLTVGKVYKAIYVFTIENVNGASALRSRSR